MRMLNNKFYKYQKSANFSNFRIVSMVPGNREVAGCFIFSKFNASFEIVN